MTFHNLQILLFGPGVRFVPEVVWHSKFFWIALVVMIVGILLYHNNFFITTANGSPFSRLFHVFTRQTGPKVLYQSQGREGYVWYQSAESKFAMYYEFGAGDCVAIIHIPPPEDWEKATQLPLAQRDEVLGFIGRQVVKDQTSGGKGRFKIEGDLLRIYSS